MARLLVVSGPSGAGKSTLLKRLLADHSSRFGFSVSHTTRSARPGEADGRDYHFVDRSAFESLAAAGAFLETAEFSRNLYGTSLEAVRRVHDAGRTCVLDIDLQGVQSVKRAASSAGLVASYVLVRPPTVDDLRTRLMVRGTETPESLALRLEAAERDIAFADAHPGFHDAVIVNDSVDRAYSELLAFVGLSQATAAL